FFLPVLCLYISFFFFFFQAEDGIRDRNVTGVQTCALPISSLYSSYKSPCVTGNHPARKPSASPSATDCHMIALSIGVKVTSNPRSSNTTLTTLEDATVESQSTIVNSIDSPSHSPKPSFHSDTKSSFSSTQLAAASSGSTPSETSSITASISSVSQLNWSKKV